MAGFKTVVRLTIFLLFLCFGIGLLIYVGKARPSVSKVANLVQPHLYLQTGDLVFRITASPSSQFVKSLDQEGAFSHIGIVYMMPNDAVFVVHVQPEPSGFVELEDVTDFFAVASDYAIYRPVTPFIHIAESAGLQALMWVGVKPYDDAFSLVSDEAFYCTELIYMAYLEAGADLFNGHFDTVDFPFLEANEVIYPSLFIRSDLFVPIYST